MLKEDIEQYRELLHKKDKFVKLPHIDRVELQDYINMRNMHVSTIVKRNVIEPITITERGVTLGQISEDYLNSRFRPIGQDESPLSLFEWVLKNTK